MLYLDLFEAFEFGSILFNEFSCVAFSEFWFAIFSVHLKGVDNLFLSLLAVTFIRFNLVFGAALYKRTSKCVNGKGIITKQNNV